MHRRGFLLLPASAAAAASLTKTPKYYVHTRPAPRAAPAREVGRVIAVHSERSIDVASAQADVATVRQMISRGMQQLTATSNDRDAWNRFFEPADFVGIKVNASGAPHIMSHPAIVAETVRNLLAVGIPPGRICIYERFRDQLDSIQYGKYLTQQVPIFAAEQPHGALRAYDPHTYVEVNFFGEDDTRSFLIRQVAERFTKIVNIPNMKDHGASGVTGCLKNMAYGNFSNVARSHAFEKTNTKTFIGTLAAVEPLRSKTVLHIMDGLKGVWHGGPFAPDPRYHFFPKQIWFGCDPVAMDRLLIDVIDGKRKQESAASVWDRSPRLLTKGRSMNPNQNRFIREPGHIEYAASLGLGMYDPSRIRLQEFEV